jgi:hypothetical protein
MASSRCSDVFFGSVAYIMDHDMKHKNATYPQPKKDPPDLTGMFLITSSISRWMSVVGALAFRFL